MATSMDGFFASRPWIKEALSKSTSPTNTVPIKPEPKKISNKKQPVIIYPLFEECSKASTDPFWVGIFDQASKGTFPRSVTFDPKTMTISYRKGNRIEESTIPTNLEEAFPTLSHFFRSIGLKSVREEEVEKQRLALSSVANCSLDQKQWKEIRKKSDRKALISWFVSDQSDNYNLTDDERNSFFDLVNIGINIKAFTESDITMENGRIKSIAGLMLNKQDDKVLIHIEPSRLHIPICHHGDDGFDSDDSDSDIISRKEEVRTKSSKKNKDKLVKEFIKLIEQLRKPPHERKNISSMMTSALQTPTIGGK